MADIPNVRKLNAHVDVTASRRILTGFHAPLPVDCLGAAGKMTVETIAKPKEAIIMKIRWIFAAFIWCLALTSWTVASESLSPLQTIKGPIDQVVAILNQPGNHSGARNTEKRDQIWKTVKPLFDFETLSRRALGSDWERFSTEEQTKFQDVFAEFLGNTYIDKIQGEYNNEKIIFIDELIRDHLALARTKLVRESLELPIDYRMRQIDGNWKIYDVLVENGVSLVKNYRVQFKSALQKETPAELIKRLEAKLKNE